MTPSSIVSMRLEYGLRHSATLTTNLAAVVCVWMCVSVQNLTNFCPHALISNPNVPKMLFAQQNSHTLPLDRFLRSIVLYFVTRNNDLECKSSRFAAVVRRSVADKQLHLNGVIRSAGVAHCQELSQKRSTQRNAAITVQTPCREQDFFSFLLFAINKAYF